MNDIAMYQEAGRLALETAEMRGRLRLTPKGFTSNGLHYRLNVDRDTLGLMVGQQAIKAMAAKLMQRVR